MKLLIHFLITNKQSLRILITWIKLIKKNYEQKMTKSNETIRALQTN